MTTKYFIGLLFLLAITFKTGICQSDYGDIDTVKFSEPCLSGELFAPELKPDEATYFTQNWIRGDIIYNDGRIIRNKYIRYNMLLDVLLWLEPVSNQAIILDKEVISEFLIHDIYSDNEVHFRKITVKNGGSNEPGEIFVQELYEGIISLFVFHSLYLKGSSKLKVKEHYILKNIYTEEPVYYLNFPDDRIIRFRKIRPKSYYELLPDKRDEIEKYFRDITSREVGTMQGILNFVRFLNSITDQ